MKNSDIPHRTKVHNAIIERAELVRDRVSDMFKV